MYPSRMQKVIEWFSSLPGMGRKSAERIVTYLLDLPDGTIQKFSEDILEMQKCIRRCSRCGNYAQGNLCFVCEDTNRDKSILCIVEQPKDIAVFEKTSKFKGCYHVLGGKLSPIEGIGPEELSLNALNERIEKENIAEAIIATSADLEGEATADYITEIFNGKKDLKISRIAFGIPYGSTLELANALTVEKALQNRTSLKKT